MRKGKLFFQISRVFYLPIYYKGIKKQDYTVYQYNPVYHFPISDNPVQSHQFYSHC